MLKRIFEDLETSTKYNNNENKQLKENQGSTSAIEHTKSMGVGEESHDSLLFEEEPNKNLKEKMENHHSFHKRPLSQNNMLRSKSSRQKRRKKTPVNNNKPQNTLISNTQNTNSKVTQEIPESEQVKSKKLVDESKFLI